VKISKKQLKKIIAEERELLEDVSYSDPSWTDLQASADDVAESLDRLADKYVTSAWLYQHDNAIAEKIAERIEDIYREAENLAGLIRGSGVGR